MKITMKDKITEKFFLPLPPTTNATYKVGNKVMYKSDEAQTWALEAFAAIKSKIHLRFTELPVHVKLIFHLKRDRDVDGSVKPVLDVLQNAQVFNNDKQVVSTYCEKKIDKDNVGVEILIEEL